MATVEERMKILKMIEADKLTAEEGAKLLAALADSRKPAGGSAASAEATGAEARWFRVHVSDLSTGRSRVNVNLPVGLVNMGLKLGARFTPGIEPDQMEAITQALKSGIAGKIIDVTDEGSGEHVEIYVE